MKVERETIKDHVEMQVIDKVELESDFLLTEEDRRRYLMLGKITYIVIPLFYLILTLIFG